jgi:hypothetical protein
MGHGVDVERKADISWHHRLQRILRALEAHPLRNQTKVFKEPHAMCVDWKDIVVERVEHHAACSLNSDSRQRSEVALESQAVERAQCGSRQVSKIPPQTRQQSFDLSRLYVAEAGVTNLVSDCRGPGRTNGIPRLELAPETPISGLMLSASRASGQDDENDLADGMTLVAEPRRAISRG